MPREKEAKTKGKEKEEKHWTMRKAKEKAKTKTRTKLQARATHKRAKDEGKDKNGTDTKKPPLLDAAVLDKYSYKAKPNNDQDDGYDVTCGDCGKVHNNRKFVI